MIDGAAQEASVICEGLTKSYGDNLAVAPLDLRVERGEFFGFLGPNGAGKSTTIKMLCGLLRPSEGRAWVLGHDVARQPLAVKARIGVLPEEVQTFERLTGWELLLFSGRMYGLSGEELYDRASKLLDLLELDDALRHRLVVDYSMGMRKKIALACALIHRPAVLFLDEPFNGIDTIVARSIRQVLKQLASTGVTIFFSSHVLEIVEKLCDRVAVIDRGRLVGVGDLESLRAQAGLGADDPLEEIFVRLVGARERDDDLDWLRSP
ncbi:MAG: ABC transporter ATP-binding protein [Planctomycetota bacterium]